MVSAFALDLTLIVIIIAAPTEYCISFNHFDILFYRYCGEDVLGQEEE